MVNEEEDDEHGELIFKKPNKTRSTWSRTYHTSNTPKSLVHSNSYYHPPNKIKLYAFSGKGDYLEWERNMDDWFYYNHVMEKERLAYAIDQLTGEAYEGWLQEQADRRFYKEPIITTWKHLKKLLRDQYVPRYKSRDKSNNKTNLFTEEDKAELQQIIDKHFKALRQQRQQKKQQEQSSSVSERKHLDRDMDQQKKLVEQEEAHEQLALNPCAPPSLVTRGAKEKQLKFKDKTNDQLTSIKNFVEAKCILPSFQSDFVLDKLTSLGPVQPSSIVHLSQVLEEKSEVEIPKSVPSIASDLEQQLISIPRPINSNESPQEHCKEIDLVRKGPNLFVLVSAEEEKRFGLENMKEFSVSKSVFDKLIPAFETLTLKTFLKHKSLLIDEISELNPSYELCKTVLKEHVFVKSFAKFSKLISLPTRALLVSNSVNDFWCSNLILDCDKVFKFHKKHSEFDSDVFRKEILFDCFNRTFDVFLLVFVKTNKGQVDNEILNTWKGKMIFKENGKELQTNREWPGLKTIKFKWKDKEEMTCQLIKEKFSNTLLVLTLSDYFRTLELEYHAIGKGIGNFLMQNKKSVAIFCERHGGQLNFQSVMRKGFKVIRDHSLWPHKKKGDVERRYQIYIISKWTNTQPHGLHHSVPIPLHSLNEIGIGFVEMLKIKMDKEFNFVIMNKFSKLFHFFYFQKSINTLHHAHLIFESVHHLNSFLKIKHVLFDAFHEFETSLNNPEFTIKFASCPRIFYFNEACKQFRTESTFVWYKTFSRMKQLLKFVCCTFIWFNELRKHVESVLNVLDQESLFENHYNLLNNSCHTFDVFSLVLLKSLKKQDSFQKKANKSNKSRTIQFGFRNWKYLRKFSLEPDPSQVFKHIKNKDHLTYLQGKSSRGKSLNVTNFVPFIADKADLRSNPFEEGGDDVIMESLEHGTKEKLVPEDYGVKELVVAEENGGKEEASLHISIGPMTRSKTKLFNQAISSLLIQAESNLSNIAYPTTLVVIQVS